MQRRLPFQLLLVSFGIALLIAGLFFDTGTATSVELQTTPASTPTIDRLAEPTLPATPSQADYGSQAYWLYCLPCHGDKGQGLTDEFRQTYPPEDRNCWNSGCHGKRPYPNGWTLPDKVPALIGPNALARFSNAAILHDFARAAMPFQDPGVMSEEKYWQVTAFLLRENGLWDGRGEINATNAASIVVHIQPTPTISSTPVATSSGEEWRTFWFVFVGFGLFAGLWFFRLFQKSKSG